MRLSIADMFNKLWVRVYFSCTYRFSALPNIAARNFPVNLSLIDHLLHLTTLMRPYLLKIIELDSLPTPNSHQRTQPKPADAKPRRQHHPLCAPMIRHAGRAAAIYTYRTPRSPYLTVVRSENPPAVLEIVAPASDAAEDAKSWCLNSGDFLICSG